MKLPFSEISQDARHFSYTGAGWFPADEISCSGVPQVEVVAKREESKVYLNGTIRFTAILSCDRCGMPVETALGEEFEYIFTLERIQPVETAEMECGDEDCITVYLQEPVIDLGELLREQVFLALPAKTLCSETCRGLCPKCGAVLQDEYCGCTNGETESPFAILGKLKRET